MSASAARSRLAWYAEAGASTCVFRSSAGRGTGRAGTETSARAQPSKAHMRLESLWGDIRFAFRIFKRSPAVALTVIATLAVALGLNATAYSFFNAYVVKPAAVHDPGTLYQASWENRGGSFHRFSWTEAEGFGRDMAGVFPETYVTMPQLVTRINGRPA